MIREEPGRSMTETLARGLASTRLLLVMLQAPCTPATLIIPKNC